MAFHPGNPLLVFRDLRDQPGLLEDLKGQPVLQGQSGLQEGQSGQLALTGFRGQLEEQV